MHSTHTGFRAEPSPLPTQRDGGEARTISIAEAAQMLNIGVQAARQGVKTGDIPSIKCGRERRVPVDALESLLRGPQVDFSELSRAIRIASINSRLAELQAQQAELKRQIEELTGEVSIKPHERRTLVP